MSVPVRANHVPIVNLEIPGEENYRRCPLEPSSILHIAASPGLIVGCYVWPSDHAPKTLAMFKAETFNIDRPRFSAELTTCSRNLFIGQLLMFRDVSSVKTRTHTSLHFAHSDSTRIQSNLNLIPVSGEGI